MAADPSLEELRERRHELQRRGDAVSYVRRVAQGRLDLVLAEQARRAERASALFDAAAVSPSTPPSPPPGLDPEDLGVDVSEVAIPDDFDDEFEAPAFDPDDDDDDDEPGDGSGLDDAALREQLSRVLADRLVASGGGHPPRPAEDFSDDPLAVELDERCSAGGFGHHHELDDADLDALRRSIEEFETELSSLRHDLFGELDELTEALVQAYRVNYERDHDARGER